MGARNELKPRLPGSAGASGRVGVEWTAGGALVAYLERGAEGAIRLERAEAPTTETVRDVGGATRRDAIASIVASSGLADRPAAGFLEGPDVLVRRITLPPMRRADILPALALELRRHVSYSVEEAEVRFEIQHHSGVGRSGGLDLLVAAAPRRAVEESRRALQEGGFRPDLLTIRPVALRALVRRKADPADHEVAAYLEMGVGESHITVLRGDEIRFTRDFGIGAASFIEALRSIVVPGRGVVTLGPEEAKTLLYERGIPRADERDGVSAGRAPSEIPGPAVSVMLRPTLERLVRELWNSFDYVNEQFQGEAVSRVVVLGEAARIPQLPEYLTGLLKIPVVRADPSFARAVAGLPLLGREPLDFLAAPGASPLQRVAEAIPGRVAVAAAAVLLLSVCVPAELTVTRERRRVAELESKLRSVEAGRAEVRRFRERRLEEERSQALLATLAAGTPRWSELLRDLSHRVGSEARLTRLEMVERPAGDAAVPGGAAAEVRGREVVLEGIVRRDDSGPERALGELMQSLEASPYLAEVRLSSCHALSPELSRFVLGAELEP